MTAAGGLVGGPDLMHLRPCRDGEQPERVLYPDGSVTVLGGVLEPCDDECRHDQGDES